MATYLDRIVAAHRAVAAEDDRATAPLVDACASLGATRGFRASLERAAVAGELAVIAEVKRRSPSKGPLAVDLDPAALAQAYERGGAACLSVLTDGPHFGGSPADLQAARAATALPVLRKDFTVSANDVCDARLMGADCVLLIVAALSATELVDYLALARRLGLDALVEVHDEAELAVAIDAGADLVGVNQRDLHTFEVDHARAQRMGGVMPAGVVRVAESGVRDHHDAERLRAAGYHAVLVGETLVRSTDPTTSVRQLRGVS